MTPLSCFCFMGCLCLHWALATQLLCERRISSQTADDSSYVYCGIFKSVCRLFFFLVLSLETFFFSFFLFFFFFFLQLTISPLVPPSHDTLSKMSAAKPAKHVSSLHTWKTPYMWEIGWFDSVCASTGAPACALAQSVKTVQRFTCAVCDKVTLRRAVLHNNEMNCKAKIWIEVIPLIAAQLLQRRPNVVTFAHC